MLLTILGALISATAVVAALRVASERRAVANAVRALRQELRQLAGAIAGHQRAEPERRASDRDDGVGGTVPREPAQGGGRGSRTLH